MILEFAHYHIPIGISLGVVMLLLGGGVVLSVVYKRGLAVGKDKEPPEELGGASSSHSSPVSTQRSRGGERWPRTRLVARTKRQQARSPP